MVFNESIVGILIVVSILWLTVLTVVVYRMVVHYNRLTKGTTKSGLRDALEVLLGQQDTTKKQLVQIHEALKALDADGKLHMQRIGIVRFNPFSDTGGSQSFTLALLDGHDNGLVMTSLYARTGNRWYVKEIRAGKAKEVALSKEEQLAITRAYHLEGKK